jgi:CRISPR-associated endonuclease/helicase Cas3
MIAYAHTATDANGKSLPDTSLWQTMPDHSLKVAARAKLFARPMHMEADAELAGLLHDLGKYAERFQQRLRNSAIHGINHWAAGAKHVLEKFGKPGQPVAFAIDGHHTGLPAASSLSEMLKWWNSSETTRELTGCTESLN